MAYTTITRNVISWCSIPESIRNTADFMNGEATDVYVELRITPKNEQEKYADDFSLENWIISQDPELEGRTIFIHVDY